MCYQVEDFQEGANHMPQHWRTKMWLVRGCDRNLSGLCGFAEGGWYPSTVSWKSPFVLNFLFYTDCNPAYAETVCSQQSLPICDDGEGTLRSWDNFVPELLVPVSYLRKKYPVKPAALQEGYSIRAREIFV